MGTFVGGFVVESKEEGLPEVVGPVLQAYVQKKAGGLEGHSVSYAARADWGFVGIFPSHESEADWDAFQWALDHSEVAAGIAKETGATVWSFYVEPRSDYAEATKFPKRGRKRSFEGLKQMAKALKIDVSSLVNDLPFLAGAQYSLAGPHDAAAFRSYLSSLPPPPTGPIVEKDANMRLFLRNEVVAELRTLAAREQTTAGQVLWAAWECAKGELHGTLPDYDQEYLAAPERHSPDVPPCAVAPSELPDLELSTTKTEAKVRLPDEPANEVVALCRHTDRTLSWMLEKAYLVGRKYFSQPLKGG